MVENCTSQWFPNTGRKVKLLQYVWSLCQAFKDIQNIHEIRSSPRVHTFAQTSYLQAVEGYNERDEDRAIKINKHRKRKRMC
jgi:hypothetical protein